MKKVVFILTMLMLSVLFACDNSKENSSSDEKKLSVVATIFAPFDFVREITGDMADVTMLLPPAAESHSFEPTPQDIIKIQNSDVFIYVGGESDEWVTEMLDSIGSKGTKIIKLVDCVELYEEETVEGMEAHEHVHEDDEEHDHEDGEEHEDGEDHEDGKEHEDDEEHDHEDGEEHEDGEDHEDGKEHEDDEEHDHEDDEEHEDGEDHEDDEEPDVVHEHEEYDEHVWTSPVNAVKIVNCITDALVEKDSTNESIYRSNAKAYNEKLMELDSKFRAVVNNSVRKTIVFGDRFPLRYFIEEYGLDYYAAFPGCSTDTEPSAATVAFLIDKVKAENIPVVFNIELSNEKMADTICAESGAEKLQFNSCHNISKKDFDEGATYLELMSENVESLKKALEE